MEANYSDSVWGNQSEHHFCQLWWVCSGAPCSCFALKPRHFKCGFLHLQLFNISPPPPPPSSHLLLSFNCTQVLSMRHLMHYVRSTAPALLTQCRGPMQTLAARRGTVGSAGRSFAHSLSTETACADWARGRGGEREREGEKKMVRQHSFEMQAKYWCQISALGDYLLMIYIIIRLLFDQKSGI